jgi:hypothetical protein
MRYMKESFMYNDLSSQEQDTLYQEFKKSYEKEVGKSWDEHTFLSRSRNWTFYGSSLGGIAVRKQNSGLIKFVAAFGNPISVARALTEMMNEERGKSIWGAMSLKLCEMLEKFSHGDFKRPPALVVKMLAKYAQKAFGDNKIEKVNNDGGIVIDMIGGIGATTKYFIANSDYFKFILNKGMEQWDVSPIIKVPVKAALGLLVK